MGFWSKFVPQKIEEKVTATQHAIVRFFGAKPQWSERNYANFAKEGYQMNVWVYACVQAIATPVSNLPWALYQLDSKGERKEIYDHPLLDLLKKPNENMSQSEFFEAYAAFLLIAGNSFVEINKPFDNSTDAIELSIMRPDRMQVKLDTENFIEGYIYQVGDQKIFLPKERVSHLKMFHPLSDFYGLSPVEPTARGIDNNNASAEWNNALLKNGARPGGALVSEHPLSDPAYEKLQKSLETNHQGAKNAGKPLLLEGGLSWQEMSLNPRDMDFIQSKKLTTVEICAGFRVPPEIVGYAETKTYSNYQEARKALYEDAVIPCANKMRDKLNVDVVPMFGDNLVLDIELSRVEALQESQDAVYKRAGEAYKYGLITQNEGRNECGYDDVPEGDKFFEPPTPAAMPGNEGQNGKKSRFF